MKETAMETVTIREVDLGRCKFCDSANVVKHGFKRLRKGTFQRFRCDGCGRHFTHNLGFERKRATPETDNDGSRSPVQRAVEPQDR